MLRISVLVLGALLALPAIAQSPVPGDAGIRALLEQRIDVERQGVGIVVGVIEPHGTRVVAHGTFATGDPRPVGGDTLFEIASITKVFTGVLLAEMVERGEVRLDQPVAELLPDGVVVPGRGGKQITLEHLATHRSGLPRLPDNLDPADWADPYADYTAEDLYAFLAGYELTRDIDEAFEYSNLGTGLLGHALARAAGVDYETLLRERILEPLGLTDTVIKLPGDLARRHATGHDGVMQPVPFWTWDVLEGTGALRSTADDLSKFLSAVIGYTETDLAPAMASATKAYADVEAGRQNTATDLAPAIALATEAHADIGAGMQIGLAWLIKPLGDDELVWHSGGSGGFRSFAGYLRNAGVGVVVLSNMGTAIGVDDLALHLLDQSLPLAPLAPPRERVEVEVDPAIYEGLTGVYELAPGVMLTITRQGDGLYAQATGEERFPIFPESETEFFYRVMYAQITFETGDDGRANALILHQPGLEMRAPRVE
ncbi:serine hydrolase [Pseudoxanthomonas suwonensis]|uniref:serine hydrolase n=1 Tax=Pseudoxanthomonas suwonensis TaxID=314722 RepID=UPI0006970732|nr:serine hydrolase [Pseudoxanthomonas suwonensis]